MLPPFLGEIKRLAIRHIKHKLDSSAIHGVTNTHIAYIQNIHSTHMNADAHACTYIQIHAHKRHAHMHMHTHKHTHAHKNMYVPHRHAHELHTHTHTCIHTYTHTHSLWFPADEHPRQGVADTRRHTNTHIPK